MNLVTIRNFKRVSPFEIKIDMRRANRPLLRGAEETRYDTESPCHLLFGMFAQV